ncbi:MAG: family 65 glycosyl hydrolase [Clostridiaceae bacterium]|nr:family 65 glycosyl hydrolase [Clostridiaceae bacterium]
MAKIANRYFKVDPWAIIEEGFEPSYGRVAESVFALANEYMGVRGYFEEGYSGERQIGCYFNGLYEETEVKHPFVYKGFVHKSRDMCHTVDWLFTRIMLDGELLDIARSKIKDFFRILDLKNGTLVREYIWETQDGKQLKMTFERFLSMITPNLGFQSISILPVNFSGTIDIISGLDFAGDQASERKWVCLKKENREDMVAILGKTKRSGLHVFSSFVLESDNITESRVIEDEKFIGLSVRLKLNENETATLVKKVVNYAEKKPLTPSEAVWKQGVEIAQKYLKTDYDNELQIHTSYWHNVWQNLDITIEGDPENQQGIRYCIYQLHQTYHGSDPTLNIGAKGLTGEAYGGKTYWDTEAYCLQFYLFNNPKAARNLLEYRYNVLPQAIERARELDCEGACYPISSIDGEEGCGAWQHASLQIHVSGSIAYGIWHYDKICGDKDFLYNKGIEMLIQICRFYASRVQQDPHTGKYGFYGVMGVDEFHMMVNNNCFLNYLVKKSMEFTLSVIEEMKVNAPDLLSEAIVKTGLKSNEPETWRRISENMIILQDKNTGLFEQHDGYFRLPHIDIHSIPVTDFPLYNSWSYDRIYRTDMIKQPDVLMMLFLYNQDFPYDVKKVNYEYYEPRCIHESSLSPSIHSILAAEIGKEDEAYEFFRFATRLDLDDYNRNTCEGLHITSIAAAWMNIVYGFGGLRSDGEYLKLSPSIPKHWKSYSFRILYKNSILSVTVTKDNAIFKVQGDSLIDVVIYEKLYQISQSDGEIIVSR